MLLMLLIPQQRRINFVNKNLVEDLVALVLKNGIPVRNIPLQNLNLKCNDDMLLYVKKGIFWELINFCDNRTNYDSSLKYEPYGPVSLSMWLHSSNYTREYLYETEIQKDGYYCDHRNSKSWIFS